MLLEGPNCLGMVNYVDRIPLTFVVTPPQPGTHASGAAIVSQSGALAAVIAVNMRRHRIPLTYSVSTGNEAASGVEDFLEHLIDDETTRVFTLVVEQFRAAEAVFGTGAEDTGGRQVYCLAAPGPEQGGSRVGGHAHGRARRRLRGDARAGHPCRRDPRREHGRTGRCFTDTGALPGAAHGRAGDLHRVRRVQSSGPGPVRAGEPPASGSFIGCGARAASSLACVHSTLESAGPYGTGAGGSRPVSAHLARSSGRRWLRKCAARNHPDGPGDDQPSSCRRYWMQSARSGRTSR